MPSTLERLREHWLDNVGLLVSGALTAAVVLRILAVAHFDVLTAAAILQRGGTTNVLVGAVLASVPSLAAAAVPLITAVVALSQKTTFRAVWVITVFLVLSIILWVLFVPSRLATLVGGSMLATSLLVLVLRRQKDRATEALALEAGAPERDAALVKALSAQGTHSRPTPTRLPLSSRRLMRSMPHRGKRRRLLNASELLPRASRRDARSLPPT